MARRDLEDFLHKRGFWTLEGKWGFFSTGSVPTLSFAMSFFILTERVPTFPDSSIKSTWVEQSFSAYVHMELRQTTFSQFYLDEISYTGTSDAIPIHFGPSEKPVEFHDLEVMAPTRKRPQGYERVLPNGHGSRLSEISRVTGDGTSYDDW